MQNLAPQNVEPDEPITENIDDEIEANISDSEETYQKQRSYSSDSEYSVRYFFSVHKCGMCLHQSLHNV